MLVKTSIKDLLIVQNKKFDDSRGHFKELIRENEIKKKFPFIVMSYSKKNVLRGMHIQTKNPQGKFISVLKGKIFDVSVDLRKNSKTFGKCFSCILSEKNSKSIFIPPGFAHGFLTSEKENYIIYSCTKYRDGKNEIAIKYDDKNLNIKWPFNKPIISAKDKNAINFIDFKRKYL